MSEPTGIRSYLDAAASAERDSLSEHSRLVDVVDRIDVLFRKLVAGRRQGEAHPISNFLAMNAHSNFLAATGAALRGQSPATFMLIRGCFESALYSYLASSSREDADAWMGRAKNPALAKRLFTANRAIQKLAAIDSNLAVLAKDSYEWMIDFGGHPNHRSIIDHLRVADPLPNGDVAFSLIYINSSGSLAVVRALAACIENGCMVLAILAHTFSDHADSDDVFSQAWKIFGEYTEYAIEDGYLDPKWRSEPSPGG